MQKNRSDNPLPTIGKVKWYSPDKGYGFITPDAGGDDVFLHVTLMKKIKMDSIPEGTKVKFHMEPGKNGKGMQATSLEIL